MTRQIFSQSSSKLNGYQLTLGLILCIALIGILVYTDYGISTDELVEIEMVAWQLESIGSEQSWQQIPGDLEHYGLFFNLISLLPYLLVNFIQHPDSSIGQIIETGLQNQQIYLLKHLFTFLFSLITYLGVALFTKELLGWNFAGVSIILLALLPRFWGHFFFNPKDIPFAALFIFTSYVGSKFTYQILSKFYKTRTSHITFIFALAFGSLVGLLTCIRIGGFVLLGFALLIQLILQLLDRPRQILKDSLRSVFPYLIVLLSWTITTILFSPVSWSSPLNWFLETINYLSKHTWEGVTLTFGQNWPGQNPPWFYLPVWLGITTPLLTLLLSVIGWIVLLKRFFQLNRIQQSNFLWLNLQIFALPLIAIVKRSTIYNAERQFLFILPAIVVFAVVGLAVLLNCIFSQFWKIVLLTTIVLIYSSIFVDMVRLHPYEYIYFNRLARIHNLERMFETDYWGISSREAIDWINRLPGSDKTVYFHAPRHSIEPFANKDITLIPHNPEIAASQLNKPFYYLAYPRNKYGSVPHPQDYFPNCKTVYRVKRRLGAVIIPLTTVKKCS